MKARLAYWWGRFRVWLRRRGPLLAYLALVAVTAFNFHLLYEQRQRGCEARNESTAESVIIGAESLIEVAAEADDETVEQYRKVLARNLEAAEVDC